MTMVPHLVADNLGHASGRIEAPRSADRLFSVLLVGRHAALQRVPGGACPLSCPSSSVASFFLVYMFFVVFTFVNVLDPIPRAADGPRLIQACHSAEVILTTLGRFLAPRRGRSVIST